LANLEEDIAEDQAPLHNREACPDGSLGRDSPPTIRGPMKKLLPPEPG
jgi:hypothetical protein